MLLPLLLLAQDGLVDRSWFRERGLTWVLAGTAEGYYAQAVV